MPIWSITKPALLLGALAILAGGQTEVPSDRSESARIATWVNQLNADEYGTREEATENLIATGRAAVLPVTRALTKNRWEVTTRGIYILRELALSPRDEEAAQAALMSLQQMATSGGGAVARRAGEALVKLNELRERRSVKLLTSLGANIDPEHEERDLYPGTMVAIEFGEDWRGQVTDLRHLRWLPQIQQVTFIGAQVTDEWISHLLVMQNLRALKVKRARLTDAATAHLKKLARLQFVKLLYVPIGDASVDHFRACRQMARLKLYGTKLTQEATDNLSRAMGKDVVVDVRKGAFLGIGPSGLGEEWFIRSVAIDSAADRAGLRPGDAITAYEGQPVRDFVALTAMIGKNDVNDTVTIRIRRGERVLERQVTFGEWD
ncbi:MAG: PDZ domain-containing protein [Pirellulaceae bacterium]